MVKKIFIMVMLLFFVVICFAGTSAYTDAKWVIVNSGLSYQQMLNLTPQDMRAAFPNKPMSGTRINNTLSYIRHYAQGKKDQASLQSLKAQAGTWLDSNFPDHEIVKGRDRGMPYITIWLEGNPNSDPNGI